MADNDSCWVPSKLVRVQTSADFVVSRIVAAL